MNAVEIRMKDVQVSLLTDVEVTLTIAEMVPACLTAEMIAAWMTVVAMIAEMIVAAEMKDGETIMVALEGLKGAVVEMIVVAVVHILRLLHQEEETIIGGMTIVMVIEVADLYLQVPLLRTMTEEAVIVITDTIKADTIV